MQLQRMPERRAKAKNYHPDPMNRIARAWMTEISLPSYCPICGEQIGKKIPAPSEKVPLVVERISNGRIERVVLHAGCQSACTAAELAEIRP
jgi:hypothetical protein